MNETPQQYVQRITGCVSGQEPLAVQATTGPMLEQLIANVQWTHYRVH